MTRRGGAVVLVAGAITALAVVARATGAAVPAAATAPHTLAGGAPAYLEGAPPGFSGGFDEPSCHACHFHGDVNSGPERVEIAGVPERFSAGARYVITVTLRRPGIRLAGFQLTARFKDDGSQAGLLAAAPGDAPRVKVETYNGVAYVSQRKEGTSLADADQARWSLEWTAPDAQRPVVFHVAANAADGDGTAEGDYVETAFAEAMPAGVQ
jgi:hypothetical protein